MKSYSTDLKLFARWFHEANGEELTPRCITPIDLREYKRYPLEDRGFKPATVNQRLGSISAFCKWAQERGLLFLQHALAVNDFRIVVTLAARQDGYEILHWLDERSLRKDEVREGLTEMTGKRETVAVVRHETRPVFVAVESPLSPPVDQRPPAGGGEGAVIKLITLARGGVAWGSWLPLNLELSFPLLTRQKDRPRIEEGWRSRSLGVILRPGAVNCLH